MGFWFSFKLSNHLHHPHTEGLIWIPFSGFYQQIVDSLTGKHRNLKVETSSSNENLLALHYSTSRRIAPIVLIAEPGWVIGTNKTTFESGGEFASARSHDVNGCWLPRTNQTLCHSDIFFQNQFFLFMAVSYAFSGAVCIPEFFWV